jgi:hypothetical protein
MYVSCCTSYIYKLECNVGHIFGNVGAPKTMECDQPGRKFNVLVFILI